MILRMRGRLQQVPKGTQQLSFQIITRTLSKKKLLLGRVVELSSLPYLTQPEIAKPLPVGALSEVNRDFGGQQLECLLVYLGPR